MIMAEQDTATIAAPTGPNALPAGKHYFLGTGRRKTAVARVRIRPGGKGTFLINGRPFDEFFTEDTYRKDVQAPLVETKTRDSLDIYVKVHGGGTTGQAGAVLLGIARALKQYDSSVDEVLREHGFLTRDAREVERKKYGLHGARRGMQWAKR